MELREKMRDYTRELMKQAHEKGTPVIRTLFTEFPNDKTCWKIEDQYMYGDKYLVAPVLYPKQTVKRVYLPEGYSWKLLDSDKVYMGGDWIEVDCPLETMPVFIKNKINKEL